MNEKSLQLRQQKVSFTEELQQAVVGTVEIQEYYEASSGIRYVSAMRNPVSQTGVKQVEQVQDDNVTAQSETEAAQSLKKSHSSIKTSVSSKERPGETFEAISNVTQQDQEAKESKIRNLEEQVIVLNEWLNVFRSIVSNCQRCSEQLAKAT